MKLVEAKEVNLLLDVKVITENTSGEITDDVILMNSEITNNTPIVYTLPRANTCEGKPIKVLCMLAESYCNIELESGDEFKGTSAYPLSLQSVGEYASFVSDGMASWYLCDNRIS